jgi:cytidylate kinase
MIVAIDGPVGVGKSTVAREVAKRLGLLHIDTGAMYRALAWKCLEEDLDCANPATMTELARRTRVDLEPSPEGPRVFCDGIDVSGPIRSPEVSSLVSEVSTHAGLREVVVNRQREMGDAGSVVMEGRDIGTVVFPQADVKVYLDASVESRVRRRTQDFESKGIPCSHEEVRKNLLHRDHIDSTRETSPLRVAEDASVIDTSDLSFEEVVQAVVDRVRETLAKRRA